MSCCCLLLGLTPFGTCMSCGQCHYTQIQILVNINMGNISMLHYKLATVERHLNTCGSETFGILWIQITDVDRKPHCFCLVNLASPYGKT